MKGLKKKGGRDLIPGEYWFWPATKDIQTIAKRSVLDIRPVLELEPEHSSRRVIVFRLSNNSIVKNFSGYS